MDYSKVVENLKKRFFDAYYVETKKEAINKILELIPKDASIGFGGSVTLNELQIKKILAERGNYLFDRDLGKTPEEANEIMRDGLKSDYFLMSSNAVTETGELFNIDGRGNRLAALCFGPKNVIVVVGKNKVVPTIEDAYDRVRNIAAPLNSKRLNCKTGCTKDMKCHDCLSPECICSQMVETRISKPSGKIKVIIINEDLGF